MHRGLHLYNQPTLLTVQVSYMYNHAIQSQLAQPDVTFHWYLDNGEQMAIEPWAVSIIYLDLLLGILKDPKSHFLVKKVVDFATVDLKEASRDGEVFLDILWLGTQSEYIRSCTLHTNKEAHMTVNNALCHCVCVCIITKFAKLPYKLVNTISYWQYTHYSCYTNLQKHRSLWWHLVPCHWTRLPWSGDINRDS